MIDPREPRNGDFARYVENLPRLPAEHRAPAPVRPGPAGGAGGEGREPAPGQAQGPSAHAVARLLGTVAVVLTVAGLGLIALTFSGDAPFVDPVLGFGLVVAGAVMNRLSRKLR
jgi:hypothetical protein